MKLMFLNLFGYSGCFSYFLWVVIFRNLSDRVIMIFLLGAVDSIIYATTRKLIKPINLPTHMRNISNSQNSSSNGPLSRNPSVYQSSPYSPSPDKTAFKISNTSEEDILTTKMDCNVSQKAENRISSICVTLETVEEVI